MVTRRSEAGHSEADSFAQEVCALFWRQGKEAADQRALGEIIFLFQCVETGFAGGAWFQG